VESMPVLETVVVDLYCSVGTFVYGSIGCLCDWYGWDPRKEPIKEGMKLVTGIFYYFYFPKNDTSFPNSSEINC
jgi:hypothetical protein